MLLYYVESKTPRSFYVEILMDVVPEGGVRDHLVVTSRWPGERQLGDSSRPVVGARKTDGSLTNPT
jgi:hypothetical protein